MASEIFQARESGVNPIKAIGKVPKGRRLGYDDDEIAIYDAEGREVERGIFDFSAYSREPMTWDEKNKNYKLRQGYRMVVV